MPKTGPSEACKSRTECCDRHIESARAVLFFFSVLLLSGRTNERGLETPRRTPPPDSSPAGRTSGPDRRPRVRRNRGWPIPARGGARIERGGGGEDCRSASGTCYVQLGKWLILKAGSVPTDQNIGAGPTMIANDFASIGNEKKKEGMCVCMCVCVDMC